MRGEYRLQAFVVAALACIACMAGTSYALNVVGMDFGGEWIKMGVVKSGEGVSIVLNEASKRKFPSVLAFFSNDERAFGDVALAKPHLTMPHLRELLGRPFDADIAAKYSKNFLPYDLRKHEERGTFTVVNPHNSTEAWPVEQLVAMIVQNAADVAAAHCGEEVRDVVLTVPSYFTHSQRRALTDAVEIAGLTPLALMNDHAAAAFKWGFEHKAEWRNQSVRAAIFDMGATSTIASLVEFASTKDKRGGQFQVLAMASDDTLGGAALTSFVEQELLKAVTIDLGDNKRAAAKLKKEAEKAKFVLSANKEYMSSIESLDNREYDFKATIARQQLEDAAIEAKFLERSTNVIDNLVSRANTSIADLARFEVVGGTWRVPLIHSHLLKHLGKEALDKTLNADEAMALGATLYAASLSVGFQLKYGVNDVNFHSVEARMLPHGDSPAAFQTKTLFGAGNKLPSTKKMSFKRNEDFVAMLAYSSKGNARAPESFPNVLERYNVSGIAQGIAKYENATDFKVDLTFRMSRSAIASLDRAELSMKDTVVVDRCEWVNATAPRFVNHSIFFAAVDVDGDGFVVMEELITMGGWNASAEEPAEGIKSTEERFKAADADGDGKLSKEELTPSEAETKAEEDSEAGHAQVLANLTGWKPPIKREKACKKVKEDRMRRLPLVVKSLGGDIAAMSPTDVRASAAALNVWKSRENAQKERAEAQNSLESFVYGLKEKVESEEWAAVTNEEQRSKIEEAATETGNWLDEDGWDAPTEDLQQKLANLKVLSGPVEDRVAEAEQRPEVVSEARSMIKEAREALAKAVDKKEWLTANDTQPVTDSIENFETWLDESEAKQKETKPWEDPVFRVNAVGKRINKVASALKALMRIKKPKAPKAETNSTNTTNPDESAKEGNGENAKEKGEEPQAEETASKDTNEGVEDVVNEEL